MNNLKKKLYTAYNSSLSERAKYLAKNMTKQERKLWFLYLKSHTLKWYRQRIINKFIVDFYCSQANLVIELDGAQHYSPQALAYDKERTTILKSYGLKVLRYTNYQIDYQFYEVCSDIELNLPKHDH